MDFYLDEFNLEYFKHKVYELGNFYVYVGKGHQKNSWKKVNFK